MIYKKGVDLPIQLKLYLDDDTPFEPNKFGYEAKLYLICGRGLVSVPDTDYTIVGNSLNWTFKASDQKVSGDYTMKLDLLKGQTLQGVYMNIDSFSLGSYGIATETLELTSHADRCFSLAIKAKMGGGGGGGTVECDTFLSLTSENPVQNKIITSALKMIDVKVTLSSSSSYVFNDVLSPVILTANVTGIEGNAQRIDIYESNGSRVGGNTNSNSCSVSVSLNATKSYYAIVTAYGGATKRSDSKTITAVGHIYFGSGSSKADFWTNKVARATAVGSPSGSYSVTIRNEGDVFYFAVPSNMSISTAKLNDLLNVPLKAADTTSYSGYKLYEGSNTMQAGTYSITLS